MSDMRKSVERISRGMQVVRLWQTLNYAEPESLRDTMIDILTDLFHVCMKSGLAWSEIVSNAEKWGLTEGVIMPVDPNRKLTDEQINRLLKDVLGKDDDL